MLELFGAVDFEDFWRIYPRKVAKLAAERAWHKAVRRVPSGKIIAGAERYRDWLSQGTPKNWRPEAAHPATWLNAGRWDDDLGRVEAVQATMPRRAIEEPPPVDPATRERVGNLMRQLAADLTKASHVRDAQSRASEAERRQRYQERVRQWSR